MSQTIIKKRIPRELKSIQEKYGKCELIFNDIENHHKFKDNEKKYQAKLILKNLKIMFDIHYPFRPPHLFISGKNYIDMLCLGDKFFLNELKKRKIRCLCCNTILCHNKWYARCRITDIIDEYYINKKLINKISKTRFVYVVCFNKNITDHIIIDNITKFI